jgi:plasmid stabilization system protein ParE
MRYAVDTSRRAKRDIRLATTWYRQRSGSQEVADIWLDAVTDSIASLAEDPLRCPLAHESDWLGVEVRELHFGSGRRKTHRILFQIEGTMVNVIAVRHFAQRDLTSDGI